MMDASWSSHGKTIGELNAEQKDSTMIECSNLLNQENSFFNLPPPEDGDPNRPYFGIPVCNEVPQMDLGGSSILDELKANENNKEIEMISPKKARQQKNK
jgi:hypothetical protein